MGDVFEFQLSPASPKFENNTQLLPERIFSLGEGVDGEIYLVGGPDPRSALMPAVRRWLSAWMRHRTRRYWAI